MEQTSPDDVEPGAANRGRGAARLFAMVNVPAPGSGATGAPLDSGLLA